MPDPSPSPDVRDLVSRIAAEVRLPMGRADRVQADCLALRACLVVPISPEAVEALLSLAALFRVRAGRILDPVLDLVDEGTRLSPYPWPIVADLFCARAPAVARRALDLLDDLTAKRALRLDRPRIMFLAERVDADGSALSTPEALTRLATVLRRGDAAQDRVLELFLSDEDARVRRLAARLLDLDGHPAPPQRARQVLGEEAFAWLQPLLDYTRATHLDLACLSPGPGVAPVCLPDLVRARDLCGESTLREVVAELGWGRFNLALTCEPFVAISVAGSFPLLVAPDEAPLLEACEGTRRAGEHFLFVAHGGTLAPLSPSESEADDPVSLFRSYNLTHAEALAEILDVAPLSREKVLRIVALLDRIVEDFERLFAEHTDEAGVLKSVYRDLRARVQAELDREPEEVHLSPELTRLVQMFEDPPSLGAVRTMHGLKRYLHQRGLALGFRLVEAGRATNRTVDLMATSSRKVQRRFKGIRYVDFEPSRILGEGPVPLPYPVRIVADGLARQLIHGHESFPGVRIFCYGNEIHYYLAYGSHPAFLRMDLAPPLQGGMIDLQYYGVSKNEMSNHPNLELDAVRAFFRQLQFDVRIENTRVHARYDKERARDLGDLCEHAEALFRLAAYLMDLDWLIGDLDLGREAQLEVARAWAESFENWGVLPVAQLLTRDRRGILLGLEAGPAGEREVRWNGQGPYRDRFMAPPAARFHAGLRRVLEQLGIDELSAVQSDPRPAGQIHLERVLLRPLREAVTRGELVPEGGTFQPAPRDLFERVHPAEEFARLLAGPDEALRTAARLARFCQPLERTLSYRTIGTVNGHEVQKARLPLRGDAYSLYALRDPQGMLRVAMFTREEALYRRRASTGDPWRFNGYLDPVELARHLRRTNYGWTGGAPEDSDDDTCELRALFHRENPHQPPPAIPEERLLRGVAASPGRAVGPALLGSEGRRPEDLEGAVLVAPAIRPADNAYLYRAAGIVSTGGGILSHAGLLASWFRKPALIVPGQWQRTANGRPVVVYTTLEYREEERDVAGCRVVLRRDMRERQRMLEEGDLVVVDADAGLLRVLGQDHELKSLHESLGAFAEAGRRLGRATDDGEILTLRGRRLRARHQLERLLGRITDVVGVRLAVREVLLGSGFSTEERAKLLRLVLSKPTTAAVAHAHLRSLARDLGRRHQDLCEPVRSVLPVASTTQEALSLRLDVIHLRSALVEATRALEACGFKRPPEASCELPDVDGLTSSRLRELRDRCRSELAQAHEQRDHVRARHRMREMERIDQVLGADPELQRWVQDVQKALAQQEAEVVESLRHRRLLEPFEVGHELWPMVGWKAANLGEVERLAGGDAVPGWFVVTHRAFEEVMETSPARLLLTGDGVPAGARTLRDAVDGIVGRADLDPPQKAALVRILFERAVLPPDLSAAIQAACRKLGSVENDEEPFLAVRSSALEEDAEAAARAGEFDTFLFVRGEVSVIEHLKRAWSGLWNERALHNRALVGSGSEWTGGGVIVQRMVASRVSGVLQTVHVAQNQSREMVINAGLGLGEGVVSGTVAADQVTVSKDGDLEHGPLRFRYATADKTEQVVFNRRAGHGTVRVETLYHQRLRPALEYIELLELVRDAARLERAYGFPLDIEFGLEGTRHWILQVRPVPVFLTVLRETVEHHPLPAAPRAPDFPRTGLEPQEVAP